MSSYKTQYRGQTVTVWTFQLGRSWRVTYQINHGPAHSTGELLQPEDRAVKEALEAAEAKIDAMLEPPRAAA